MGDFFRVPGQLVMQQGGGASRAVYQHAAMPFALICNHEEGSILQTADFPCFRAEAEDDSVCRRVVRQGKGQFIRADNPAGGHQQGAQYTRIQRRLQAQRLFPVDVFQPGHPVLFSPVLQLRQGFPVLFRKADHQRAAHPEGDAEFLAKGRKKPGTFHIIQGLLRPRQGIVSGVDDAAVRLGGAFRHIPGLFDDGYSGLEAAELPGHGTPDHAASDDQNIGLFPHEISSFASCPERIRPERRGFCFLYYHRSGKTANLCYYVPASRFSGGYRSWIGQAACSGICVRGRSR